MSESLSSFFNDLQRQLNPTIFTTEWVSHRIMHVDFAMLDGDLATVKTCFEEMDLILKEREFPISVLEQIVDQSTSTPELKHAFWTAWQNRDEIHENQLHRDFMFFVVECFARLVFRYKL